MRLDLATEWRSRRWRRLLNVIDQLPRDSAYVEALSDDDEIAGQLMRTGPEKPARPQRRLSDWSPTVELLTTINDRLGDLIQTVAALGGAKPRKIPRGPYPVTAAERARHRERMTNHQNLVARVLRRPQPPPATGPDVNGG